ncbi:MAG: lactate racemase domain-containing protein [Planctomycetota bacterium]
MSTQSIPVSVGAWHGDHEETLHFPKTWEVEVCEMKGHNAPALGDDEILARLNAPINSPPLQEISSGKQRVVILFDDLCRPTPAARIVPSVLRELRAGGIQDDQIRFVAASGAHQAMTEEEFAKKLGMEVCERYPVYNHHPFDHNVEIGKTSFGTPLFINGEAMSCDLKIGIGGLIPYHSKSHLFGGGAKIVLPGVSGIETITHHHREVSRQPSESDPDGFSAERLNIEEAAAMAGLNFKIDLLLNGRREVADLVAGDAVKSFREGCRRGRQFYGTKVAPGADIVVVNAYPQATQSYKALWCVESSVREGGDVVLLSHRPEGMQQFHYLFGRFGGKRGGDLRGARHRPRFPQVRQMTVVCPYVTKLDTETFRQAERMVFCKRWEEALRELLPHHGDGTRVAVYPCAPIQMAMDAK